jgi:hypothetical protein
MANNETPMNAKSNKWAIVIDPPKEKPTREYLEGLMSTLLSYFKNDFIATIIHDKDKENGKPKTIHLHAFIEIGEKQTKRAFLDTLTELLSCNEDQISLRATNSDFLIVQYLIHKNDKDKTQYPSNLVFTNNLTELAKRLNTEYVKPKSDLDRLLEANTLTELADKEGIDFAKKYMYLHEKIMQESKRDYNSLSQQLENCKQLVREFDNATRLIVERYLDLKMLPNDEDMERLIQVVKLKAIYFPDL